MDEMTLFVLFAIIVLVAVAIARRRTRMGDFSYRQCAILTPNEAEFFGRLRAALPEHYVFPQVAMSAIIAPNGYARSRHAAFNKIARKRVDFVICTDRLQLVVLVELDDRTHDAGRDAKRDAMTRSAGIRTIRFLSSNRPSVAEIRAAILPPSAAPRTGDSFTALD
ncbi:DUF2726 domain-containing protein [Paraburkholderia sp. JHI869]|uniref:DUF2726 domain-containing protein n=1 Tax=Paraburkholderia sp. JHI869 TaxID=3112959 RepID=UPI00316D6805